MPQDDFQAEREKGITMNQPHLIQTKRGSSRNRGQCLCKWCGMPLLKTAYCPADREVREAVRQWAATHGRTWKRQLIDAWTRGDDIGHDLQRARNVIGPSQLLKIPSWAL